MPRRIRSLACLLIALAVTLVAAACGSTLETPEVGPVSPEVAPRGPVDPAVDAWFRATRPVRGTVIEPGDRIRVELQGLPQYNITREVPPDGIVPLFRSSQTIVAGGRTVQQVEADVTRAYAGTVDAYVTVTVVESVPRVVYIAGAVNSPQAYSIRSGEPLTVLQALTLAGGPTTSADLYGVTIMRLHPERGQIVSSPPLDIASVQRRGDQTDNLIVMPGDTVVVPEASARQVHILGHIEQPGPLRWYEGITLSRAITEAGGFRKFARQDQIRVVRDGGRTTIRFDFTSLLAGEVEDLVLAPGDVIYVDERWI